MLMQKKLVLLFLILTGAVITYILLGYFKENREENYARAECFKQASLINKTDTPAYELPENIDCTPYETELNAAFPVGP